MGLVRSRTFFFVSAAAFAAGAWMLSPVVQEYATEVVVAAIPHHEDISLGIRGVDRAGYRLQNPCRPGRRCLEAIGRDVLQSMASSMPELRPTIDAYDWMFSVTQQSFVNAFAFPGGRIFITSGMLDACTDDELLAVTIDPRLAHSARGTGHCIRALVSPWRVHCVWRRCWATRWAMCSIGARRSASCRSASAHCSWTRCSLATATAASRASARR
jgi:hypothetical protein